MSLVLSCLFEKEIKERAQTLYSQNSNDQNGSQERTGELLQSEQGLNGKYNTVLLYLFDWGTVYCDDNMVTYIEKNGLIINLKDTECTEFCICE